MAFFQFQQSQEFSEPVEKIWEFISNPANLKIITPDYMGFDITSKEVPTSMYAGMIISYKVSPLFNIKTTWVTEITHVQEGRYFVDEQRVGPYKIWHHQHFLEATPKGTLMKDIISYQPPFGFLGTIANSLLIRKKLNEIFTYREQKLNELFKP